MRKAAQKELERRGYYVRCITGQGILPGTRLEVTKDGGSPKKVAVRTSYERLVSFARHPDGEAWRTLSKVDLVVVAVPSKNNSEKIEVLTFYAGVMIDVFDEALGALLQTHKDPPYGMPIYVPLDAKNKKNFGHPVAGLKAKAIRETEINAVELNALASKNENDTFIERVKREFAEKNDVDVGKVVVEFRIVA
jgi:hypothetical protein